MINEKKQSLYKSHGVIYSDPVAGKFGNIRFLTMSFVFLLFFIIPWINLNNRQIFLFDIATARLYFFNLIFWPEDFSLLAIFLIICIFLLFAVTVYAGRIWCGFFCPQSIWIRFSAFFIKLIKGNRNYRKKIDSGNFNFIFFYKNFLIHLFFLFFSFLTSFTFIGYFVSVSILLTKLKNFDFYSWSFFWIGFFFFLTYFNISWFKEQFCFLVCPYARLQSIMFDENTLIIAYDFKRGETRGSRKKDYDYKKNGLGDCIDCKKCVTCCPTGIDIRNGLQMECISCAACIDACNSVMLKIGYEPNLIKYSKESDINDANKKFSKIRFFLYLFFLFFLIFIFSYRLFDRNLIQFTVNRSQLQLFNINKDFIENSYFLKLTNKTNVKDTYCIEINNEKFKYIGLKKVSLDPEDTVLIDIKLLLFDKNLTSKFNDIYFSARSENKPKIKIIKKSKFILP